jgi:hypothetical protein
MQNEMTLPIRAAPDRHQMETVTQEEVGMKISDHMTPPVLVKLYEHQITAYLFVLGLFDALDQSAADKGGDADERFHG